MEKETENNHLVPRAKEQQTENDHPPSTAEEQQTESDRPAPTAEEEQMENESPAPSVDEQQTENGHPKATEQQSHHNFVHVALELLENADFPEKCDVPQTTFRDNVKRVVDRSLAYVKIFADFCFFGRDENRLKRIREKLQGDDLGELTDFIDQLKTFLEKLQKSYEDVKAATDDFFSTVQKAVQNCRDQERRENVKKNTTRAVGGVATAGLLAAGVGTGVTLSIVAGVFTFGVGTIVGLALTAAGTAVVGTGLAAGTGVATHYTAAHFAGEQSKCEKLNDSCNKVLSSATCMDDQIRALGVEVETIATNLENVQKTRMSHNARPSLVVALDRLLQRFMELDYDTFVALQRELEAKRRDFQPN